MVRVSSDAHAVDSSTAEDGRCKPIDGDAVDGEDSPLQSKRSSRFFTQRKYAKDLHFNFVLEEL